MFNHIFRQKKVFLFFQFLFFLFYACKTVEQPAPSEIILSCSETAYPGEAIVVTAITFPNSEKIEEIHAELIELKQTSGKTSAASKKTDAAPKTTAQSTSEEKKIGSFKGFKYNAFDRTVAANVRQNAECFAVIIGADCTLKSGSYKALVFINGSEKKEFAVSIKEKKFKTEEINLNKRLTGIRTDTSPKRRNEAALLSQVLSSFNQESIFLSEKFNKPLFADPIYRTSEFGERRKFIYDDGASAQSIHWGIDLAAKKGTPVYAVADGKVVFADERIVTGNSIAIEHLPGFFTLYYHLDKLAVTAGQQVSKGYLIGFVGATGLATGAHLHWEVRNQNIALDPDFFIDNSIIDKEKIISIIKEKIAGAAKGR